MIEDSYLTSREILERLVKLETSTRHEFSNMKDALVLARETAELARKDAKNALDHKLEEANGVREQMNKMEGKLALKSELATEVKGVRELIFGNTNTLTSRLEGLAKLVYIGLGVAMALQFLFKFWAK